MADQPDPVRPEPARADTARAEAGTPPPVRTQAPSPEAYVAPEAPVAAPPRRSARRRWLTILALVVGAVAVLALFYHFLIGVRHVSTDNAYVGADTAQITPLVAGQVREVRVANTMQVRRGDVLIVIDPEDARIAAAQATAELARTRRQLAETRATGGSLEAQLTARASDIGRAAAEVTAAQAAFDKARVDLGRRQRLAGAGAVSGDELTSARNSFAAAQAQLAVAQSGLAQARAQRTAASESLAANRALTRGPDDQNPEVAAARAKLDAAKLDLSRTVIRAPIDGIVAQRNVQIGQRVAAGTPIMTIVPTRAMYVDANYKEGQLGRVRIGQPATLRADIYGGRFTYHGRVIGFAGGTGSAFALIPAQNATGNWIKVVQRLPVRIALDARELADHPLRVGLSMEADIDVSNH